MESLTIVTLNIAAASPERADQLSDSWLRATAADVYILTETSDGEGTRRLLNEFVSAGWQVLRGSTHLGDRGVAIATRVVVTERSDYPTCDPAPGRTLIVTLATAPQIELLGMYVPNRGNDVGKIGRKEAFLNCWGRYLTDPRNRRTRVLVGDLNVVPRTQKPDFLPQLPSEYAWFHQLQQAGGLYDAAQRHAEQHESTWVAYTGEGYTYDHILLSHDLAARVTDFRYDHRTRQTLKVSDHSAVQLSLQIDAAEYVHRNPFRRLKQATLF